MNRSNQPWRAAKAAEVTWEDEVPVALPFGDVYFSRDDGAAESRHVFLAGSDLPARWSDRPERPFTLFETGFGTGLNFLLTWHSFRTSAPAGARLHYLAVERYPLAPQDLRRALALWPGLERLAGALLGDYPGLMPGQHRLLLDGGRVVLDLWWEDVEAVLADLASHQQRVVDAWYLDGFAPSRNEAMWQPGLFAAMARLSRDGASIATFTAAGRVRRALAAAGFDVQRVPGYGRKRECLRGRLAQAAPAPAAAALTPWDLPKSRTAAPAAALVIGAGLAGAHCAAALARRGIAVTVLDRSGIAAAGSGNAQGLLFTRLSRRHSSLVDFSLQAFAFATRWYRDLFRRGLLREGVDGSLSGYLQVAADAAEWRAMADRLSPLAEWVECLDAGAAGERIGTPLAVGGYWYRQSGWLSPPAVCRALLRDRAPGRGGSRAGALRVIENCGTLSLRRVRGRWQARSADDRVLAEAEVAVVCAGTDSASIGGLDWLPLQAIRGQTTDLPATSAWRALRGGLSHEGYIPPPRQGVHCIGATFAPGDTEPGLRAADHRHNLAALAAANPLWSDALAAVDPATLGGRVGFRCASADYLPLIGPVPSVDCFLSVYAALRRNARSVIPRPAPCVPGLWLSTGYGSRGLTYTPLAAELLASQVCGEPPPLSRELGRALSPARFLARDLARNRR